MTILYFTATGNGLYVAKQIGGNLVSIPKAIKENRFHFADDKIGIIFPIYGGAVPPYIREFLRRLQLDSKYIFAIMSYGMFDSGATSHLLKLASENDIHFSYVNIIKMVDNYLPGFHMDKQVEGEPKKRIRQHLDKIIDDINCSKHLIHKDSFMDQFITKIMLKSDSFRTGIGITDKYSVEDTCIKCGICEAVCPKNNIQVTNAKPAFGSECISCLACTHNCPQNAIRLSTEKSRTRFRHPQIQLNEIIDSNR